jgi:hypothetical protein
MSRLPTSCSSVTGILLFLTAAINWYSKKITTVESATTYVEQLIDLVRTTTLRYLGVQMCYEKSSMFGEHPSVVYSAMNPTSYLHKRHIVLSYHRVSEAIANGKIVFTHISGGKHPADILSKHWDASDVSHRLQLWKDRDTIGAPEKENSASVAAVTVQASSISEFCGYEHEFTGGRVRGNTQIHSV